uniref:Uncharacterized protein n=1 Tax=Cacopsylla melanoneura TaxID=428564 RepID=A0A8D8M704_9HEMI
MKLSRLLATAILLATLLLNIHPAVCQDDKGLSNDSNSTRIADSTETDQPHASALTINSQIGSEVSGLDEYEDDLDDLELQASEHEIEAVYSGVGAVPLDQQDKPKKPKRRRRRRRRRKRIRTSTSSYEDLEANSDLADLPGAARDLPPPPASSYPRRKPNKRRRKTTTPIPLEEEYLLTTKNDPKKSTAPLAPSHGQEDPLLITKNDPKPHRPENIEEIIEQDSIQTQDSLKIKPNPIKTEIKHNKPVNNIPPVIVMPESVAPVPTAVTILSRNNISKIEYPAVPENFTESLDTEMLTPTGKQNKINVRLSEPILFVTAPQGVDFTELAKATPPVKIVPSKVSTTASPVVIVVNTTHVTPKTPVVTTTTVQPTKEPTKHTATPKSTTKKANAVAINSSSENATSTTTEKSSTDVRKPIRRPPSVNTLFRKRFQPTPHTTTETVKPETIKHMVESTTVSKEVEIAELKLYTESPLELHKVPAKLNEIPPTSKINTFKPLKDSIVHEKDLGDNSVYKKDELKLKYVSTTTAPVKHSQTSGTHIAYTPNIDLIIEYTSSTRKPTTSTEQATTEDESLNTISTGLKESGTGYSSKESSKTSGEDEAVRINLEIPQVKDDILIFLKSKAESNKLSKILASRNMTLNELIEHRERGSSQLHLAEIFKSEPKAILEPEFDVIQTETTKAPLPDILSFFPTSNPQDNTQKETEKDRREPKFLFDSMPQFPLQAEASQTIYTTKRFGPELHYTRTRPLLPNAKLTPFYGSSEELLLSYTSSTGRPMLYGNDEIGIVREHDGHRRIPSELKSVITISGAIIAFAVLGFFVLLISCKVRHRKAQKFIKHGMLREHMREATLRSSTRSDTPVVKNGYYAGCDHMSDTSSTARKAYLWKTIRKTFRYE